MRRIIHNVLAFAAASSATTGWAQESNSVRSPEGRGRGAVNIEEVIVTAQKREERLQDVPISISVLNDRALESAQIQSVQDALRTVPGIAMYESGQGGMNKIAVRGVTSNQSLFNGSSTTGYYLDEIPFAFVRYPVTPDANAFDLQRVEVLRGPQGTLYGANSLNGVVRILTQDANLEEVQFKSRAMYSSTTDGGEGYRADAALNVPLVEGKLAVRGVAGYLDEPGWIDAPLLSRKDVNDRQAKNLRLKVNAAPTENLSVELSTWAARSDRGGLPVSRDDRTAPIGVPQKLESELDAHGLTLTYDFDTFSLLSATSHLEYSGLSHFAQAIPSGFDILLTQLEAKLVSQEFRLSSSIDGPWKWSAGAIYRDAKDHRFQDALGDLLFLSVIEQEYTSQSVALYGEISRSFFDQKLEFTAGVRYFEDEVETTEISGRNPTDIPFGAKTEKFDAVTPRIVATYRLTDDTNVYASYSQGFRSGFTQDAELLRASGGVAASVHPDKLHNYEIGAKGLFFDRLAYDLAIYYINWEDPVQVLALNFGTQEFPFIAFGAVNAIAIRGKGIDFSTVFSVTERFDIGASFSWNDLHFTEDVLTGIPAFPVAYREGLRPTESPKVTAGGSINYTLPLAARYLARFTGSVNYTSEMTAPGDLGTVAQGDDLTQTRASIAFESDKGWSITLYGDNLNDEDGRVRPTAGLLGQSDRLRPRTYGVQLGYNFN